MPVELWGRDLLDIGGREDPMDDVARVRRNDEEGPAYIGPRHRRDDRHRGVASLEGDLPFQREGFPGRGRGLATASQRVFGPENPGRGIEIWERGRFDPPRGPPDGKGGGNGGGQ